MAFCSKCGSTLIDGQQFCSKCGGNSAPAMVRDESGTSLFIFGLLFGCWGVHQFVSGNTKRGLVYLLCSTLGAVLVIRPLVIFVLVLIDLFKISKSDFYNPEKTVRYVGAPWMKVIAIIWILFIPALIILGIIAAIAVPKMFGMSAKAKVAEVQPAAGTYVKLVQAFHLETNKLGSWEEIGYVAPGATTSGPSGETANFIYTDLNPGFMATNKNDFNDCPAGNKWTVVPELILSEGSYSELKINVSVPDESGCAVLTPNFTNIQ